MLKRIIFPVLIVLFIVSNAFGQESRFGVTANFGVGRTALDNAVGLQIGVNPFFNVSNHIAIEGQLSAMRTRGTGFLSGDEVSENLFLMAGGARVYFTKPDKKWRPYVNLLAGMAYLVDNVEGSENELQPGISIGTYITHQKGFSLGVALESTDHIMLKMGYRF